MQTVDILRDQRVQLAAALELGQREMSGVRRQPGRMIETTAPRAPPHVGIGHVVVNVRELLCLRIARPHALRASKIRNARIGRDPCAGEHHQS